MAVLRTLVLCEKPMAAARIALAIDEEGIPRKLDSHGVPYFECGTRQGPVIVCSAVGHLYSVAPKGRTNSGLYPVWDNQWRPKSERKRAFTRISRWIYAITALAKTADEFVNACDNDAEGALIGYMALKHACSASASQSSRMVFSTMTESELKKAFRDSVPDLGVLQVESGRCRHELDWLYGINLSRVLTNSTLREGHGYATLSTGRVQGPTLRFVVDRENEIGYHLPIPYWIIDAEIDYQGRQYAVDYYREKIDTHHEAKGIIDDCRGTTLSVRETVSSLEEQRPPYPFDLSTLQTESFRHFGYSPSRTLALAEELYLDALISYPRTASQKLPSSIGYSNILKQLASQANYPEALKLFEKGWVRPAQGFKDDPAHPAIHPTGHAPGFHLDSPKGRLYDLVVRRFLAGFANPAILRSQRAVLERKDHVFYLSGKGIESLGWIEFYKHYSSIETRTLPSLKPGDNITISSIDALERFSQPPARFSSLSLLRRMEEEGIGTKATRAGIIEILYKREYVSKTRLTPSPLAKSVISTLDRYCPPITNPRLTEEMESSVARVQEDRTSRKLIILDAVQCLRKVMLSLIEHEEELGQALGAVLAVQKQATISFKNPCPLCASTLTIVKNRKTGKRFVGCKGRWENNCRFALPLPQYGTITILERSCKECGFQLIRASSGRRRPSESCPRCYANRLTKKHSTADATEAARNLKV